MTLRTGSPLGRQRWVVCALLFVGANTFHKHQTRREDAPRLWQKYREKIAAPEGAKASGVWNPKRSGLCKKHCPVAECEFYGS